MRENHPNDVIAKDGWHVVRNERQYDMWGKNKKMIWYATYHHHKDRGLTRCVTSPVATLMPGGGLERYQGHSEEEEGEIALVARLFCRGCSTEVPDYIQGFLKMIAWSEEDARSK